MTKRMRIYSGRNSAGCSDGHSSGRCFLIWKSVRGNPYGGERKRSSNGIRFKLLKTSDEDMHFGILHIRAQTFKALIYGEAKKDNSTLSVIKRTAVRKNTEFEEILVCTKPTVRPQFRYCFQVWNSYPKHGREQRRTGEILYRTAA